MPVSTSARRVAIACQGGGSHTAFTAGVLKRLLREQDQPFEIAGLSGTSGGAICALLAWYGLLQGDKEKAARLLDSFWREISAYQPWDAWLNAVVVNTARVRLRAIFPTADVSPYALSPWFQERLKYLLETHVPFRRLPGLLGPTSPALLIGAVNVCNGNFRVFKNAEITAEAVLASTAIPTLFRAVEVEGELYWDGLFSQNPPIRDLSRLGADEIWLIQINPRQRATTPTTVDEIVDRRNELTGNLSMEQEIDFILQLNDFIRQGQLVNTGLRETTIRRIIMERDLDAASKLERSPAFIKDMMAYGEQQAGEFLRGL